MLQQTPEKGPDFEVLILAHLCGDILSALQLTHI